MPEICIIVPVLNEQANVIPLLERVDASLSGRSYTVCVVDDGSTDGTRQLLEDAKQRQPERLHLIYRTKKGRGSQRGSALHISMLWGMGDPEVAYMVEMDGDLSHRPEELGAGLALLEKGEADAVIASKYVTGSQITNRPVERRLVSRLCNIAVRMLLSRRIRDYSNGYRWYNRRAAGAVASTRIKYGSPIYLSEVMAIWLRSGMKIVEIPTSYIGRNEGISKLRVIDLVKAGLAVFEISSRRHLLGFKNVKPDRPRS